MPSTARPPTPPPKKCAVVFESAARYAEAETSGEEVLDSEETKEMTSWREE